MEPEKRPGWTEIIESLNEELESHPPGQGPCFYRRMKAENETTVVASSSSSWASPVSLGMQASSSRMESLPNSEHHTPGSFLSTGLLEMQQQGTGPVKSQALPIIWEEDFDFAKWEKISVWRELLLRGHEIPNGEAAFKALMPREVARALEDIAAVEVNITSRYREAIAAWYTAMETWMPLTREEPESWKVIKRRKAVEEHFTVEYGISFDHLWDKIRDVLDAWREESPVEFQAWKVAVEEACMQNTVKSKIDKLKKRVSGPSPIIVTASWREDMYVLEFLYFRLRKAQFKFRELDSPRAV